MKFNLFEPNQAVYFMGKLYRVIWASKDFACIQLAGTYGDGLTQMGATINSLAFNRQIVKTSHWSFYRA